MKVSCFSFLN